MSQVQFLIEDNVPIPKREVEFGPRGSQYPIEQMVQGQSFVVPVEGVDGAQYTDKDGNVTTLTWAEDAKKKASQKQSYFSALGRKTGIKVVTRYFADDAQHGPHLRVWHDGPRVEGDEGEQEEGEQTFANEGEEVNLD